MRELGDVFVSGFKEAGGVGGEGHRDIGSEREWAKPDGKVGCGGSESWERD